MLVLFILPLHVAIILEQELIQNKLMLSVDPGFCEVGMCPCQCQHSEQGGTVHACCGHTLQLCAKLCV